MSLGRASLHLEEGARDDVRLRAQLEQATRREPSVTRSLGFDSNRNRLRFRESRAVGTDAPSAYGEMSATKMSPSPRSRWERGHVTESRLTAPFEKILAIRLRLREERSVRTTSERLRRNVGANRRGRRS